MTQISLRRKPLSNCTSPRLQRATDFARTHPKHSIAEISQRFDVTRTTLGRRIIGTQKARDEAHRHQQLFDDAEEQALVEWIMGMDELGFPITMDLLRSMA